MLNAFQRVRPRLPDGAPKQRAPGRPGPKTSPLASGVRLRGSRAPRLQAVVPRPAAVTAPVRLRDAAGRPNASLAPRNFGSEIFDSVTSHRDAERRQAMRRARI